MNQVLGIRPASNQRAGHFGRIFQNRGNKTNQGPLKGAKRPQRISFRASTLSLPFFPHRVYRRIKPTPTFHPPPRNRGGGVARKSNGEPRGPPNPLGTAAERRDYFSNPAEKRRIPPRRVTCPAPWGPGEPKTKTRGSAGLRVGRGGCARGGSGLGGWALRPGRVGALGAE